MHENDESKFPPPLPGGEPRRLPAMPQLSGTSWGMLFLAGIVLFAPIFFWFFCRIEPDSGEIAVLVRKTGEDLPSGSILAIEEGQKGVQLEVLPEGRYFKNPYTWGWSIHRITDIPAGKLGIKVRLFGTDLPAGKILAKEGTKGIVREVLRPGKYRVNPYAYDVPLFDAITIQPGRVGVVTSLVGDDVMYEDLPAEKRNAFLVGENMKGVLPDVLDPGSYYLNPYVVSVAEVNLQSQRFEMSGKDVISFLTLDGFTVTVEGTIEFGLDRDQSALLTHRVGDMDDIVKKVILPRARGFSRIEGSKHPAINFIIGETRQKFQEELAMHLRDRCQDWGVDIKSVLIRKIVVPDAIASINRKREVAVQDAKKYDQQISQAQSKAELVRQEMLAQQSKEKVEAETRRIQAVINAQQDQAVRVIAEKQDLEVAKLDDQAATFRAEAIVLKAEGERDSIKLHQEAEAVVLGDQVKAFDTGMNLARYRLYQKIGPNIESILSSDEGEGLGAIFGPFVPKGREVAP